MTPLPNGESGIFIGENGGGAKIAGNTIAFNSEMGIALARNGAWSAIRQNSMRHNGGLGIDIGLDGRNLQVVDDEKAQPNAPALLSAEATALGTSVTLTIVTSLGASFAAWSEIDFFLNDTPDGNGETYIGTASVQDIRGQPVTVTLSGGTYTGKWINGTSTRRWNVAGFKMPPADDVALENGSLSATSDVSNSILIR